MSYTCFLSDLTEGLSIYLKVFSIDTARYVLAAGIVHLLVNKVLKTNVARRLHPAPPSWKQMWREVRFSFLTIAIFSANGFLMITGQAAGLLPIYEDINTYGYVYLLAATALMIVGHDAWFYWTHRIIHHPRLFKTIHLTHHRSKQPTAWAAYAFDPLEAVINVAYVPLFLAFVPMHGLGIFIFLTHMIIRNALGHCGHEVFPAAMPGHPVGRLLTNVRHHDLHHRDMRGNYGLYFTWWDRMMGTEHPEYSDLAALSKAARDAMPRLKAPAE